MCLRYFELLMHDGKRSLGAFLFLWIILPSQNTLSLVDAAACNGIGLEEICETLSKLDEMTLEQEALDEMALDEMTLEQEALDENRRHCSNGQRVSRG